MRLERDGWEKLQDWKYKYVGHGFRTDQPEIRERVSPKNPGIRLAMNRSISGFKYKESFTVVRGDHRVDLRGAEWADWDRRGRLVFVRGGRIFASDLRAFPELEETELADLNPLKPAALAAPDWARRW
jgi:hypothetical protein